MNTAHPAPSLFVRFAKCIVPRAIRPTQLLGSRIVAKTGQTVFSGPFQGMKYLEHSYWNLYYPKLLGTYEKELAAAVEALITARPALIVNVGAGEGYFAVGLARRLPETKIIAFEATPSERERLARMCQMNDVAGQIDIRGTCEVESLDQAMQGAVAPWVICDVEGYEDVLLRPALLSNSASASYIVEVHEFAKATLKQDLLDRFSATHDCQVITAAKRAPEEFPFPSTLTRMLPSMFVTGPMSEFRPREMCWMVMTPKKKQPNRHAN